MKDFLYSGSDPTFATDIYESFEAFGETVKKTIKRAADAVDEVVERVFATSRVFFDDGADAAPHVLYARIAAVDELSPLDRLLASIGAGQLPAVPEGLRAALSVAANSGRPANIDEWAERLAEDLASADDDA